MAKLKPGAITIDLVTGGIYGDVDHCPREDLLESAEALLSLLPEVDHKGLWGFAKDFDAQCYLYTTNKRYWVPEGLHLDTDIDGARHFSLLVFRQIVRDACWRSRWYEPLIGSFRGGKVSADTEGIVDLTTEARAEMEQLRREFEDEEASKPRQLKIPF